MIQSKNDKLFNKLKKISSKNWKLDSFEREQHSKFVEDDNELYIIGKDIFDNFGLKDYKINLFVDICSAPGNYSKIVLDTYDKTTGIGISLPVEEGGVPFTIIDPRFKIFYKNILDKNYKLDLANKLKLDLGFASCVSYQHDAKNAFYLNIELIIKSLMLILPNLRKGGNLIINMTMKNIELAFNFINIISELFDNYKLWKSEKVWATKNTFYFFGYDFKENYDSEKLIGIINSLKKKNDPINNYFIGSQNEYKLIYSKIKEIYIVRLNAWEKLISRK